MYVGMYPCVNVACISMYDVYVVCVSIRYMSVYGCSMCTYVHVRV